MQNRNETKSAYLCDINYVYVDELGKCKKKKIDEQLKMCLDFLFGARNLSKIGSQSSDAMLSPCKCALTFSFRRL